MEDIDKILEKYFEGETSLEEESTLRNYFRQPDIEEKYKIYTPIFNFFSEERKEFTKEKTKRRIPLYTWIAVAASLLLIISIKFIYDTSPKEENTLVYIDGQKVTDTYTINTEALNSIENISELDEDIISSQIGILDSFTE